MALSAAALWGTTGTAQTFASSQTSPYWIGALRLVIASLFFGVVVLVARLRAVPVKSFPRSAWRWVILGGLCISAYNLSFFAGVKASGIATGTAVAIGSGPVWVGLLQSLLTKQVPRPFWWFGTALAITGIGLMLSDHSEGAPFDGRGFGLCLAAGLAYAGYTLVSKHLVGLATPEMATCLVFTVAAIFALPIAATLSSAFTASSATWLMVSYLGLIATGISYLLFSHALCRISVTTSVTLSLAEPVTAFVLAICVVGEHPGALAIGGLGLVMSGLLLVVWVESQYHLR